MKKLFYRLASKIAPRLYSFFVFRADALRAAEDARDSFLSGDANEAAINFYYVIYVLREMNAR